jgi:DNA-binding response OmpR family regulator
MHKKILFVEDDSAIRFALKYELSDNGYQFIMVEDSPQAFAIVLSENPDLIVLDVMLPSGHEEGFRLCQRLKADDSTQRIPIIILTARPARDESIAKQMGADRFFTKPPDIFEFKQAIRELLNEV